MDLTNPSITPAGLPLLKNMAASVDWQARFLQSSIEPSMQTNHMTTQSGQPHVPSTSTTSFKSCAVGKKALQSGLSKYETFKSEAVESDTEIHSTMSADDTEEMDNNTHALDMYRTVKIEYEEDYDADTDVENYPKTNLTTLKDSKTLKKITKKPKKKKPRQRRDTEVIVCADCNRTYHTKEKYELHFQKNNGKCYFKCDYCPKIFYFKKSKLDVHIRSAHTKERPYVCEVCGKGFVTSDKLKIHNRVHTGEKPCVCDQCGKAFYSLGQLSIHKNYHHIWKQHPKSFKCDQCSAAFNSKNYLKYHIKVIHCTTRDYHCHVCPKSFKSTDGLRCHLKFTHADSNAFKCDKCDKTFKTPAGMRRHKTRHLAVIPKRFVCTVCEKAFVEKDKLNMHMNIHTGNKPFKCNICDFRCAFSGNLSKHKKTHGLISSFKDDDLPLPTTPNPYLPQATLQTSIDNILANEPPVQTSTHPLNLESNAI